MYIDIISRAHSSLDSSETEEFTKHMQITTLLPATVGNYIRIDIKGHTHELKILKVVADTNQGGKGIVYLEPYSIHNLKNKI